MIGESFLVENIEVKYLEGWKKVAYSLYQDNKELNEDEIRFLPSELKERISMELSEKMKYGTYEIDLNKM